jgi:hypothetical protein
VPGLPEAAAIFQSKRYFGVSGAGAGVFAPSFFGSAASVIWGLTAVGNAMVFLLAGV